LKKAFVFLSGQPSDIKPTLRQAQGDQN